jgi:hypothetical protein
LTARRDRSDEYALADVITGNSWADLLDDSNRFVTDHETGRNRIFTSHDVKISSANRGKRHAYDRLTHAGPWFVDLFDTDVVLTVKNICSHFDHSFSMQCGHYAIESVINSAQTCSQFLAVLFAVVSQESLAELFAFSVQAVPQKSVSSANRDFS